MFSFIASTIFRFLRCMTGNHSYNCIWNISDGYSFGVCPMPDDCPNSYLYISAGNNVNYSDAKTYRIRYFHEENQIKNLFSSVAVIMNAALFW